MMATDVRLRAPRLPVARGPLSRAVVDHCAGRGALVGLQRMGLVPGDDPFHHHLHLAPALLAAEQPGLDHAGVVEHQQVALGELARKVRKGQVAQ